VTTDDRAGQKQLHSVFDFSLDATRESKWKGAYLSLFGCAIRGDPTAVAPKQPLIAIGQNAGLVKYNSKLASYILPRNEGVYKKYYIRQCIKWKM
jgi:hypothetical protein